MASADTTTTGMPAVVVVVLQVAQQFQAVDVGQVHVQQHQARAGAGGSRPGRPAR